MKNKLSILIHSRYMLVALAVLASFIYTPLAPKNTYAVSKCDTYFENINDITHFSNCAESTETCSNSATNSVFNNADYLGNPIFTTAQLDEIETNAPFYKKAADREGIPWQILAAIHGKEHGFKRGSTNADGPYQITTGDYPVKDTYSDEEFQTASDKAASFFKSKAGGKDLTDMNNVKAVLFAYNGASSAYVTQAKNLGFSDDEAARGEGSPYVMNRFDEKRDPTVEPTKSNGTWGQIKQNHGSIEYPANSGVGTFVYYSALTNASLCGGSASLNNGDANSVQKAFSEYMSAHNETYNGPLNLGYTIGGNGCTTVSSWYIGEYTTLTYGRGNGEAVVRNLVSANSQLTVSDKPIAPAIFSVAGGVETWGSSGSSAGHVGLVVSVNEQTRKATVVHTGSSKRGAVDKAWVSEYSYPASGVTFVGVGDYLK